MPNALLSGSCDAGRSLPQGYRHLSLDTWWSCQLAMTVMGGKRGSDAHMSAEEAIHQIWFMRFRHDFAVQHRNRMLGTRAAHAKRLAVRELRCGQVLAKGVPPPFT